MLQNLDFIYMPSPDAANDIRHFEEALGGEIVFAIERFGTRVAMVRLGSDSTAVLFAEHLEGERPVLVYRVDDLNAATAQLRGRGAEVGRRVRDPARPDSRGLHAGGQPGRNLRTHPPRAR